MNVAWKKLTYDTSPANPRFGHSAVLYQKKLILFGGRTKLNNYTFNADVEVFNIGKQYLFHKFFRRFVMGNTYSEHKNPFESSKEPHFWTYQQSNPHSRRTVWRKHSFERFPLIKHKSVSMDFSVDLWEFSMSCFIRTHFNPCLPKRCPKQSSI